MKNYEIKMLYFNLTSLVIWKSISNACLIFQEKRDAEEALLMLQNRNQQETFTIIETEVKNNG